MFIRTSSTLASVSACLVLGSAAAWAGTLTGVTSSAALGANDFIDWGQLGPEYSTVTSPTHWTSALGDFGVVGNLDSSDLLRLDQNNGWGGNFTPGDPLLWNQSTDSPIRLVSTSPLSGFGANIQSESFGNFTATITAYDSSFNPLGSFSEVGNSNPNGDGSAIFIGLTDTDPEIHAFSFDVVDQNGGHSLAINTVLINYQPLTVPEPGSVALLAGFGLSGAGFLLRKRRQ